MDHNFILKNIEKHISLDKEETDYFISLLRYKEVAKKDYLLREGQNCNYISYVHSGALRAYHLDKEGKESTIMFAINDWWITDMYCFIMKQPAMQYIEAIKKSSVLQLKKDDLEKLYHEVPKFERFFRIIMQNSYIREQLRVLQNLSLSAQERYLHFRAKYPQVMPHISQKQIASYLGITPEFLSSIRKNTLKDQLS